MRPSGMHEHGGQDGYPVAPCHDIRWSLIPADDECITARQFHQEDQRIDGNYQDSDNREPEWASGDVT